MRVGIRVSPRSSGGGRAYVEGLRRALQGNDRCQDPVVFLMGPSSEKSIDSAGAVPVDVPTDAVRRRIQGAGALRDAVREHPVDVMLCPGTEATPLGEVPVVMWPMTVAPFEAAAMAQMGVTMLARVRWRLLRESIEYSTMHAHGLVFSSYYARALHVQHIPALADKRTAVIPPAHTLPDDLSAPDSPSLVDGPYVLFVSHLYPYKMVSQMIVGYARAVRRGGITHKLVIAGNAVDPRYAAELNATAVREGVGDRVQFLGGVHQSKLPSLYAQADLFIFPSISENAGSFALVDAFTMATPVLSSSTSSMPEACQDAVRYFDPREPDQLCDELLLILQKPDLLAELSRRSAARAQAFPDWAEVGERLVDFLAETCGDGGVQR